jgi:hypothetical protein
VVLVVVVVVVVVVTAVVVVCDSVILKQPMMGWPSRNLFVCASQVKSSPLVSLKAVAEPVGSDQRK